MSAIDTVIAILAAAGTIIAALTGGVLGEAIYSTIGSRLMAVFAMAATAVGVEAYVSYAYFGTDILQLCTFDAPLFCMVSVLIGFLANKAMIALSNTPELQPDPTDYLFSSDAPSFHNLVIGAAAVFNGVIGLVVTMKALELFGPWGLLFAAVASTVTIFATAGVGFWICFVAMVISWSFQKFCQLTIAIAAKLTGDDWSN